jgi:elongation factor P
MKIAQELRAGNVVMIDGQPVVILKAEFSKSGRNASVVKMKLKNLLNSGGTEQIYRADEKFDDIILEKKDVTFSYFGDPMYVFMDAEYNQYEIEAEAMGNALNYVEQDMPCQVTFYDGRAISIELPTSLVREVEYTEPAVRGDTSGKVMKPARLKGTGFTIPVPAFVEIGDKIEIDTRTDEYRRRV